MMNNLSRPLAYVASLLGLVVLAGCVHSPPSDPWDPIEPVNRAVYKFNDTADRYILQPVARGYDKITPDPVQRSVTNFFHNAHAPVTIVNSALQLKFDSFNVALGRFMVNTTAGVGGLFDVASNIGIADPDEDFGQTFGYYGLGQGPYLVLPFLGPSSGRDFTGSLGDQFLYPITYLDEFHEIDQNYPYLPYMLRGLEVLNLRASLLGFEETLNQQFDPYAFLRGYYLENRLKAVYDGNVPPERMYGDDMGADDE
ncbi:MlaA family lipoprotein [Salinisphaera aquimarina]|uniref:VacJ family lipoprotein n=1 Tax=Salinisphaera aquimarina TaxID=2094031 RepID=A0ABV7EQE4_9GAMM